MKNEKVHRIKLILQDKSDFLFVCQIFTFEKSDISAHSFKINNESESQFALFNFNQLNIKKIVDEVVLGKNSYFVAESLDKFD